MQAARVSPGKAAPQLREKVNELDGLVVEFTNTIGIADGFVHLLKLRASQLNECAYCVRLHARDALRAGESADRVSLVAAWRDSQYFDEKERAGLALVESITLIADEHVPDDVYAGAAAVLSDDEIAAVQWIVTVISAWNRISIPGRPTVTP